MHPYYDRVTDRCRQALNFANSLALRKKHPLVTNLHVLWGILEEGKNVGSQVLRHLKVDLNKLKSQIEDKLPYGSYLSNDVAAPYAPDVCHTMCVAIDIGKAVHHVGCHHLLQGILIDTANPAAILLDKWDVSQELVVAHLRAIVKPIATQ